MAEILNTCGAGFFGGILKRRHFAEGHACVSIDLQPDDDQHPNLKCKGCPGTPCKLCLGNKQGETLD
jgi:hypothetical protein